VTSLPFLGEEGEGEEGSEREEGEGDEEEVDPMGKESERGIKKRVRKERSQVIHWNCAVYRERR
jgi:hypothetical protein